MWLGRPPEGAGLGFRRELISAMQAEMPSSVQFFELAPENWADLGGKSAKTLRSFTERYPFVCHGLSLSLGGPAPLDENLLIRIKAFMRNHGITMYTEHLSWCSDQSHLYELLPIPLTEAAARWTADRIARAQDILGQQIGIENASTYLVPPGAEMTEPEFLTEILQRADCALHLDVNNVYVNSCNFQFDPYHYLQSLPLEKTCYIHVAGHYQESDGFLIDTHGMPVIDPVWDLLSWTYQRLLTKTGRIPPTCLERDFNFPSLHDLNQEVAQIARLQHMAQEQANSSPAMMDLRGVTTMDAPYREAA